MVTTGTVMGKHPTLLAIYAHPDDEVLGAGGTLALYAAMGVHVALVVATRALGISELIFLDYRDSGMAGSSDNEHPQALVNASGSEVVSQLADIIRRLQPGVVLTFEPYGGYGHPDHISLFDNLAPQD